MTEGEQHDLYLLERHFGIPVDEALHGRPAWQLDMLLVFLRSELAAGADTGAPPDLGMPSDPADDPDPFAVVPDSIQKMRGGDG